MSQEDQSWISRGRTVSAIEPNSRVEFQRSQLDHDELSPNRRGLLMKLSPALLSSSNSKLDEMDYEEKLIRYKLLLEKVNVCLYKLFTKFLS